MYDHKIVESKWQKKWREEGTYQPDLNSSKKPFYNLMMFPYPSAEGLHVGNMYAFSGADVYGRFNRMLGKDVFEPIGLDGFGIHSENYAIKVGRHPSEHAKISQENFYNQLSSIGNGFAWDNRLETYDPAYYKWTQWLFIQLYKKGLAYKASASVNWCPFDKTVLADEQVINGKCERCGNDVERKDMSSWFFKITEYADRLLGGLKDIDWPEKIKIAQTQWIGKKSGINITYNIKDTQDSVVCFTTRPDTNFGATFIVLAPELAQKYLKIIPSEYKNEVENYIKTSLNKTEQQRQEEGREKTGVFTGLYAINNLNNKELPIWVGDFVLSGFGTGAVVGVPGHDRRDFEFAQKFGIEIIRVVVSSDGDKSPIAKLDQVQEDQGVMINSQFLDGMNINEATEKIINYLEEEGYGKRVTSYHLRDWLISRQRYWGPPIPMINCSKCGWQPVPESDLPVLLPDIVDFKPKGDGTSPLANAPDEWQNVECPSCKGMAKRELDVSDTFLDSSWYFLRYPSVNKREENEPWDEEITKNWLPVDAYIGGAEHAVLHLLYARFVTMVLHDLGKVDFDEPFPFLYGHGLIIKDGAKMSKSKGNVVIPDEYIEKYGADTLRTYLMFLGPYDQGGDFRDTGIEGMHRFIKRIWSLFSDIDKSKETTFPDTTIKMHQTIKKVTSEMSNFRFNTSIAAIMEYVNVMKDKGASKEHLEVLAQLVAPFAPHMAEEAWVEVLGNKFSIHKSNWPKFDEKYLVATSVVIPVQVDGRLRAQLTIDADKITDKAHVIDQAKNDINVSKWIEGKDIENIVYVEGKILNLITS